MRYKRLSTTLKTLLGNDFTVREGKYKMTSGGVTKVSLWSTEDAAVLISYHAFENGNKIAQSICRALMATTFDIIINDAFGRDYNRYQAEVWSNTRDYGKEVRRLFTDAIKDWLQKRMSHLSRPEQGKWYMLASEEINLVVLGKTALNIRRLRGGEVTRDLLEKRELDSITKLEDLSVKLLDKYPHKYCPVSVVREVAKRLELV